MRGKNDVNVCVDIYVHADASKHIYDLKRGFIIIDASKHIYDLKRGSIIIDASKHIYDLKRGFIIIASIPSPATLSRTSSPSLSLDDNADLALVVLGFRA